MLSFRTLLAVLLVATVALAGCADKGDAPKTTDPPVVPPPSEGKGVLFGVVVDDAIRPVAGATIDAVGPGGVALSATTDAEGAWGFTDLEPGTYFVTASKLGYFTAQQSADVLADVDAPPAVRLLLGVDVENLPFAETLVFDGFIECSSSAFGFCGFANDIGEFAGVDNATNDDTQRRYELQRAPSWIQSEMTWSSTQAAGNSLSLMYSYDLGDLGYRNHGVDGTSPLILSADEEMSQTLYTDEANEGQLYIRVFIDEAAEGAVAGAAFQQEFRIVTNIFYGYAPPEGWTFGSTGEVPEPA